MSSPSSSPARTEPTLESLVQLYGYDRQRAEHVLAVLEGAEAGSKRVSPSGVA